MDDADFQRILDSMALSWTGYRRVRKAVKSRLSRRMMEIGAATVEDYLQIIREDPVERGTAGILLTVPISRFFRDRTLWESLGELITGTDWRKRTSCTAWCAGCASGEEVYSLKILWEQLSSATPLPPLEIVATDVNAALLERARHGEYPPSSLREVDETSKQRYFTKAGGVFVVLRDLARGIRWTVHDFTNTPPPCKRCDLIFMRNNLLTYYDPSIVTPVLKGIVEVLRDGGLLIVGNNERLPDGYRPLKATVAYRSIFRKETGPANG